MTPSFIARTSPNETDFAALTRWRNDCPFSTPAYANARQRLGRTPVLLAVVVDGAIVEGCLGFIQRGALTRQLEIVSAPPLAHADLFWHGVRDFCRNHGIWQLNVESFGSPSTQLPTFDTLVSRRARAEHVLDLSAPDALSRVSTNHTRNAARARKAGCALVCVADREGLVRHLELMRSSLERRRDRGEEIVVPERALFSEALLATGAGELYQVRCGEAVLSSLLLIRSAGGAYYHSAGTSAAGMQAGASSFLIMELARRLIETGTSLLNLGGAGEDEEGLRRFKKGFGAREVCLEAASYSLVSPWVRRLGSALRSLRHDPRSLMRQFVQLEHYAVFSATPSRLMQPAGEETDALGLRPLLDEEMSSLKASAIWREQGERFDRLGWNAAYGLFRGGELVHISWLIDEAHDRNNSVRNVRLRSGEAEITHCFTPEAQRGRGCYQAAIRQLCRRAAQGGVQRVFMITAIDNTASRAGISAAGLSRCGSIYRLLLLSWTRRPLSFTLRGHRWRRPP